MKEKYLPIGTVCLLKGGKKDIMINGYLPIPKDDESVMYDYSGCVFPEGILDSNTTAVFNHDQIVEIKHMGLENDEYKAFMDRLKEVLSKDNSLPPLADSSNVANEPSDQTTDERTSFMMPAPVEESAVETSIAPEGEIPEVAPIQMPEEVDVSPIE